MAEDVAGEDTEEEVTMKHTPGPWTTNPRAILSRVFADGGLRGGDDIASVHGANDKANARLIAAAPELLEAVKAMQKACDEWAAEFTQKKRAMDWGVVNDAYLKASAAIAKATGK